MHFLFYFNDGVHWTAMRKIYLFIMNIYLIDTINKLFIRLKNTMYLSSYFPMLQFFEKIGLLIWVLFKFELKTVCYN